MSLALIRAAGRRLAATAAAQSPSASSFSSSAAGGAAASTTLPDGEEILPPPRPDSLPPASADARDFFRFEIVYESKVSRARVGRLHTPNGVVDTPAFVAVGTNAALKAVDQRCATLVAATRHVIAPASQRRLLVRYSSPITRLPPSTHPLAGRLTPPACSSCFAIRTTCCSNRGRSSSHRPAVSTAS